MKTSSKSYNWVNVIFFALTPLVAVVGTAWLVATGQFHGGTLVFALVFWIATGMSITGGYHRLFSHHSYQTKGPIRFIYTLFGSSAFQGSVLWWAAEHRIHHRYEDTDRDPYNIKRGFWFAHIGWLLEKREDASFDGVQDLQKYPLLVWQNRFYVPIAIVTGFLFPMGLGALWGDAWGGLILGGFARLVVSHHTTFCINSLCHTLGKQTYSRDLTARDSWISSLVTYGEGYHNFHHTFQFDYRNGLRFFQWDPTKWLIAILSALGLAKNLKRAPQQHILKVRIEREEQHYLKRLIDYSDGVHERATLLLESAKVQVAQAQARFFELKREYHEMKRSRLDSMSDHLLELKREIRAARRDFKLAMDDWRAVVRGPIPLSSS